ncbi:hypothetical protein P261_01331 [Lachnospiraceae bacterium TWA4]|nr:hypothetical protein P261_01331 [Lachnospiraceae bacterium TWA4]
MNKIIGLYGNNLNYLTKLGGSFNQYIQSEIMVFSEFESLEQLIFNQDKNLDALIVDGIIDLPILIKEKLNKNHIIYLSDIDYCTDSEVIINKYQPSKYLVLNILNILEIHIKANNSVEHLFEQVVGIYSPSSFTYKTSLSVLTGQRFAEKGKQVLIISLDEFSTLNDRFIEHYDLSDLLYYQSQNRLNLELFYKSISNIHELTYIYPCNCSEDIRSITSLQLEQLIIWILENSLADQIVLDIGNAVNHSVEILKLCAKIYLPLVNNSYQEEKIFQFEEYLRGRAEDKLMDRIEKVAIDREKIEENSWFKDYYEQLIWKKLNN